MRADLSALMLRVNIYINTPTAAEFKFRTDLSALYLMALAVFILEERIYSVHYFITIVNTQGILLCGGVCLCIAFSPNYRVRSDANFQFAKW